MVQLYFNSFIWRAVLATVTFWTISAGLANPVLVCHLPLDVWNHDEGLNEQTLDLSPCSEVMLSTSNVLFNPDPTNAEEANADQEALEKILTLRDRFPFVRFTLSLRPDVASRTPPVDIFAHRGAGLILSLYVKHFRLVSFDMPWAQAERLSDDAWNALRKQVPGVNLTTTFADATERLVDSDTVRRVASRVDRIYVAPAGSSWYRTGANLHRPATTATDSLELNEGTFLEQYMKLNLNRNKLIVGQAIETMLWTDQEEERATVDSTLNGRMAEMDLISYWPSCDWTTEVGWQSLDDSNNMFARKALAPSGRQWIVRVDPAIVNVKASLLLRHGFAGIGLYDLHIDDFRGRCSSSKGETYPLAKTLRRVVDGLDVFNFSSTASMCLPFIGLTTDCHTPRSHLLIPVEDHCPDDHFRCAESDVCIPSLWICDSYNDCVNGSDERSCAPQQSQGSFESDDAVEANGNAVHLVQDDPTPLLNGIDCLGQLNCPSSVPSVEADQISMSTGISIDSAVDEEEPRCPHSFFLCKTSQICIPSSWVCNGESDCKDGSDERACDHINPVHDIAESLTPLQDRRCPEYNFQCSASKVCIPKNWVCDGEKDCHDNSDELDCLKTTKPLPETDLATELTSDRVQATRNHQETHCPESEFSCATSRVCIPAVWVCDGQKDCADDSDELACSPPELKPNFEPRASNLPLTTEDSIRNQAIFELTSDEPLLLGGSTHTTSRPNGGDVLFKETIPAEHFHPTSTNENPTDFSEQSNENFRCPSEFDFRCNNSNVCVPPHWMCDGENDCADGSDEESCDSIRNEAQTSTEKNDLTTKSDEYQGTTELSFDLDPIDTVSGCTGSDFRCNTSQTCIPSAWVCDGQNDCYDASDEHDCSQDLLHENKDPDIQCLSSMFRCHDGSVCLPLNWVCDGDEDCHDGSDERICVQVESDSEQEIRTTETPKAIVRIHQLAQCPDFGFKCIASQVCIPSDWVCDGQRDCADGTDELECPLIDVRSIEKSLTPNSENKPEEGIITSAILDFLSSEKPSPSNVANSFNLAANYQDTKCPESDFQCSVSKVCIPSKWFCDGHQDCADNSDELDCSPHEAKIIQESTTLRPDNEEEQISRLSYLIRSLPETECLHSGFKCKASQVCIPSSWVCDGQKDCADDSDEFDCPNNLKSGKRESLSTVTEPKRKDLITTTEIPAVRSSPNSPCSESDFQCRESRVCIPLAWVCDGQWDCADNSDELACSPSESETNFEPRASNLPLTTEDSIGNQASLELTSAEPIFLEHLAQTTSRPNSVDLHDTEIRTKEPLHWTTVHDPTNRPHTSDLSISEESSTNIRTDSTVESKNEVIVKESDIDAKVPGRIISLRACRESLQLDFDADSKATDPALAPTLLRLFRWLWNGSPTKTST